MKLKKIYIALPFILIIPIIVSFYGCALLVGIADESTKNKEESVSLLHYNRITSNSFQYTEFIYLINDSNKAISAFRGRVIILNDYGEVGKTFNVSIDSTTASRNPFENEFEDVFEGDLTYNKSIPAKSKFFIFREVGGWNRFFWSEFKAETPNREDVKITQGHINVWPSKKTFFILDDIVFVE